MQKHQHKTNKEVRDALKVVSKSINAPYSEVLQLFRNGDEHVVVE